MVVETWLHVSYLSYHVISLITSSASCIALFTFLRSILPTKRNLFTFLDALLVLSMTGCVDVMVSKNSQRLGGCMYVSLFFNHVPFSVLWSCELFDIWSALFLVGDICVCCISMAGRSRHGHHRCIEPRQDLPDNEGELNSQDMVSLSSYSLLSSTSLTMRRHSNMRLGSFYF